MTADVLPPPVKPPARGATLWPAWLRHGTAAAIDLLFPPKCASCGCECDSAPDQPLWCATCSRQLTPPARPMCPRCSMPCPEHAAPAGPCPLCRGRRLQFDQARSLGLYEGPLRHAVLRCKHARYEPLAAGLGRRLAQRVRECPFDGPPELVAAVPMFWLQRLWRGANAAETLALAVAAELCLPAATGLLVCRRFLRKQSMLRPDERRRNVRYAFRASWRYDIRGARLLLVDDVMTTGATAQEAARVLKTAGAAAVYVAAVARGSGVR